jgi:hypothetical protein
MINYFKTMTAKKYFEYVDLGFRNSLKFKGRTTREEFWCFVSFILLIIFNVNNWIHSENLNIFLIIITYIPLASISCRRLHDMNKSGWTQAFFLVPNHTLIFFETLPPFSVRIINLIISICWLCYLSQKRFNGKTKYDE